MNRGESLCGLYIFQVGLDLRSRAGRGHGERGDRQGGKGRRDLDEGVVQGRRTGRQRTAREGGASGLRIFGLGLDLWSRAVARACRWRPGRQAQARSGWWRGGGAAHRQAGGNARKEGLVRAFRPPSVGAERKTHRWSVLYMFTSLIRNGSDKN